MPVVGQHMTQVAGQRRGRVALAVQLGLGIARGRVRVVASRFAAPILGPATIVGTVLAPQALVAGPGLDERAVHADLAGRGGNFCLDRN